MKIIGRKIGQYKILAELGVGGMAVVYKAVQESLNRLVAVKELKNDIAGDESVVERFEREALSIAGLTHHNIVHMYDYMERYGSRYMVMEFVEGIDLSELLMRVDRLPSDITAIIALQVAKALEYAHYRGVVHRDIKPSNIMLSKQGEVKLMDFGIARHEQMGDLTLPGTALGTPSYMSPEQIMAQRVDNRSDIFSFGIVFYQMLTGVKPFVEDEDTSVMQKILIGKYTRPRKHYSDIPRIIQRIVKRCIQPNPDRRYQETEHLRQDLERYCSRYISVNYAGRLVLFLRNRDIISNSEAETFVRPEMLDDLLMADIDKGKQLAPRKWRLKTAVLALGFSFITTAMALAGLQYGWFPGYWLSWIPGLFATVEVYTRPWTEVYIAGRDRPLLDTRTGNSFLLLPGRYDLVLKNPACQPTSVTIDLDSDATTKIRRRLRGCGPAP